MRYRYGVSLYGGIPWVDACFAFNTGYRHCGGQAMEAGRLTICCMIGWALLSSGGLDECNCSRDADHAFTSETCHGVFVLVYN